MRCRHLKAVYSCETFLTHVAPRIQVLNREKLPRPAERIEPLMIQGLRKAAQFSLHLQAWCSASFREKQTLMTVSYIDCPNRLRRFQEDFLYQTTLPHMITAMGNFSNKDRKHKEEDEWYASDLQIAICMGTVSDSISEAVDGWKAKFSQEGYPYQCLIRLWNTLYAASIL